MTGGGVFMMGTGASSGKTLLSRALCRLAIRAGAPLRPHKPVSLVERPWGAAEPPVDLSLHLLAVAAGRGHADGLASFVAVEDGDAWEVRTGAGEPWARLPLLCRDQLDWSRLPAERRAATVARLDADLAGDGPWLVEGSSSPTDLGTADLANHAAWRACRLPIVLVGGAQRGGCVASVTGTMRLLPADVRDGVRGVIVNGAPSRAVGERWARRIEAETGVGCLGVVEEIDLYAGLPERGSDVPVAGSWDEETNLVADLLAPLWEPVAALCDPSS